MRPRQDRPVRQIRTSDALPGVRSPARRARSRTGLGGPSAEGSVLVRTSAFHRRGRCGVGAGRFVTMATRGPRASACVRLDAPAAARLWTAVLARQGLHPDTQLATVSDIARAGLGIHAARLATPIATVVARAADPSLGLDTIGRQDARGLTTIRCMRRTLHLLPVDLAAIAHRATLAYRERDALRLAAKVGAGPVILDRVMDRLAGVLAEGPLSPRQIEVELGRHGVDVPHARAGVKVAWERGRLTYLNVSSGWNQESRAFSLTETTCPGLLHEVDPRQAVAELVTGYFDRYGPATVRDAMWWSALSRRDVLAGMDSCGVEWVEVHTPWASSPAFMPASRHEEALAAGGGWSGALVLLAHEDVALKAYFESRARYLGDLAPTRVFNPIGEVLPTIVADGVIVGRWDWDRHQRTVVTRPLVPALSRGVGRDIARAAGRLTEVLRAGWVAAPRARDLTHPDQLALAI
jgi:hypothetical protein